MFTVYVLLSEKTGVTYTGYTSNLAKRLESHNSLATKGFTIKHRPWLLIYSENFDLKSDAIRREKELKQGRGREFIKNLINRTV
jgi:putative endonuclease